MDREVRAEKIKGLYAIADNAFRPELTPVQLAEAFLKGGAGIVQLRVKRDNGQRTTDIGLTARAIRDLKKNHNFTFIINDTVELAKEIGADGIHVGADDMPVSEVRKIVGDKIIIGYSSHSLEEAVRAETAGADYVAFGAIFPTKTKGPGHPVQGLEKLRAVVQAVGVPVVAIGGIDHKNIASVLETGVSAVAMITALTEAKDIVNETRSYHRRF